MIKNRIREIREELGISQQHLAEVVGISTLSISRYESGKSFPSIGVCLSICRALGKFLDDVFYIEKGDES